MLAICKVPGAHSVARNLQSSWGALGGSRFAKFPERTRWFEFLQLFWSARNGSQFARFLERTRVLAICKVPGAHAVVRNLQRPWSALVGSKFAKFPERTRRAEFLCKVPGAHAKARNLQSSRAVVRILHNSRSSRGGSKIAKLPERTRWFEFCKVPRARAVARILPGEIPSPSEIPSLSPFPLPPLLSPPRPRHRPLILPHPPFPHSPTRPPIHATTRMQSLWRACGRMAAPDGINKRHSPLARPYSTRKPRCGQTPETLSTQ